MYTKLKNQAIQETQVYKKKRCRI